MRTADPYRDTDVIDARAPRFNQAVIGLLALVAVVGLAKVETPAIEAGVAAVGYPATFVGVVIALLVTVAEPLAAPEEYKPLLASIDPTPLAIDQTTPDGGMVRPN